MNRLSTGLLIASATENAVNFAAGVWEAKQGFVNATGPKVVNGPMNYLLVHPGWGAAETIFGQIGSNITANHTARHRSNERLAHIESAIFLAGRIAGTILTYRAYQKFQRSK